MVEVYLVPMARDTAALKADVQALGTRMGAMEQLDLEPSCTVTTDTMVLIGGRWVVPVPVPAPPPLQAAQCGTWSVTVEMEPPSTELARPLRASEYPP